jgi:hypothetical protein
VASAAGVARNTTAILSSANVDALIAYGFLRFLAQTV